MIIYYINVNQIYNIIIILSYINIINNIINNIFYIL